MSDTYVTVKAVNKDGVLTPVGADNPLPSDCIILEDITRFDLSHGDIVVDTYGKPWMIDIDNERRPVAAAVEVSTQPREALPLNELEAPMVVIYREGEPVDQLIEA
jgi:hypothetical protein